VVAVAVGFALMAVVLERVVRVVVVTVKPETM
jgi:hypothetical protein